MLTYILNDNERKKEILHRKFSPISGYEPDPKRREWQTSKDCLCCPYYVQRGIPYPIDGCPGIYTLMRCLWNFDEWPLGDPSFCRFSHYREVLFRRFR